MAQKFVTPVTIRNLTSASSDGLAVSVDGDTNDRIKVEAGGRLVWGSGSATGDANLYRSGVGAVKTDHTFEAESGVITLTSSGAPTSTIADGAIAVDTTNSKFYYRSNSAWNTISGGATVSTTAPSNPSEGDIWFDSNTGDTLVYYGSVWVDVGGSSVANIAVQTTAPSNPVNGDLWFDTDTAKTYVWYDDGTSAQWVEVGAASAAASGTDGAIQFASGGTFSSDASNLFWDDTNNRLGIGTTTPDRTLHVYGATQLSSSTGGGQTYFPFTDGRFYYTADPETGGTGDHVFRHYSGGSYVEQMRILENGNVGIGNTAPTEKLQVQGNIRVDGDLQIEGYTNPSQPSGNIISYASSSVAAWSSGCTSDGGRNHMRFSSPSYPAIGAIVTSSGNTYYYNYSDYRLKDNVVPLANAGDIVTSLNPISYTMRYSPEVTHLGFLAHELQEHIPSAVGGQKDEVDDEGNPVYQSVDLSKVVPVLTAALKEALTTITDLTARIEALEAN